MQVRLRPQPYIRDPGVVSSSPVSIQAFNPERIIGQPPGRVDLHVHALAEELVEQAPPSRIGECLGQQVDAATSGDQEVTWKEPHQHKEA